MAKTISETKQAKNSRPVETAARTKGNGSPQKKFGEGLSTEQLLSFYYNMRVTREVEDTIYRLYQQGKIVGGAYSGRGNEATAVATAATLTKEDYILPLHRDMGAHIVKGQSLRRIMLQYLGKRDGMAHGRDGTGHYIDGTLKIYGNVSHLGAMVPVAAGIALSAKIQKKNFVAMTYIGDGGASVGEVHEGLIFASVMKLPMILIIENNQFAYSTPISKQFITKKLSDRAVGYGIPGVTVDGTDVLEVYKVTKEAVDRARRGEGPTIIESVTMRMMGHAAHDNAWYVPKQLLEDWKKRDPVEQYEKRLLENGLLTEAKKKEIMGKIEREVEDALKFAEASPLPAPEDELTGVYSGS